MMTALRVLVVGVGVGALRVLFVVGVGVGALRVLFVVVGVGVGVGSEEEG